MADESKIIYVYADWMAEGPVLMGKLFVEASRGKEIFSFQYDENWMSDPTSSFLMDPDLALYQGRQYVPLDKALFGIFSDSCPDRWGRVLMKRREAITARKEGRKPRTLSESDFLLGVHDEARMGALRFSLEEGGVFLAGDKELATPPWTTLRKLEAASYAFENDDSGLDERWVNQLLAPGSSLGGARPKATVQDVNGELWIAKFPSRHDETNSGAWEKVVHDLAEKCGLDVPMARLETFSKNGGTFLTKRFDRSGGKRIHFASAMTLLGKADGASAADGASYLELASFIRSNGAESRQDLIELWKRIVFNMAVSNTDDHLRNHGFLLTKKGWRLSPMYDVNPVPYGDTLSLNVDESDNSISIDLAVDTANYFGMEKDTAKVMADEITEIVRTHWTGLAEANGLNRNAIEYMRPAFMICGT